MPTQSGRPLFFIFHSTSKNILIECTEVTMRIDSTILQWTLYPVYTSHSPFVINSGRPCESWLSLPPHHPFYIMLTTWLQQSRPTSRWRRTWGARLGHRQRGQ
ncbi:hypothetical protein EYC80_005084 [Monilinia laxa]|uniref:Uncharacterized protein n=1 Tax=Monilinia laxa TaxID=61186 RepID=A0A5N6KJ56_MONLA|nr:hypothetical protein EYC80_005084 [Monilinia laxa]